MFTLQASAQDLIDFTFKIQKPHGLVIKQFTHVPAGEFVEFRSKVKQLDDLPVKIQDRKIAILNCFAQDMISAKCFPDNIRAMCQELKKLSPKQVSCK